MSHPFRASILWHGCCSYIPISGTAAFGKQASQGYTKKRRVRNKSNKPDTDRTDITTRRRSSTQASDRQPRLMRGFFCPHDPRRKSHARQVAPARACIGSEAARRAKKKRQPAQLPRGPGFSRLSASIASRGVAQPHLESPQLRQVMQPSIMTTAAVLQRAHSCAPSGKWVLAKASVCLARASYSARFSSTSFCWC